MALCINPGAEENYVGECSDTNEKGKVCSSWRGVAGMYAAITAGAQGTDVRLFEKSVN
jgi:hypothetical protein